MKGVKKFEDALLLEEVQDFVENTLSNIPTETLENVIKRMSNRIKKNKKVNKYFNCLIRF